MILHVRAQSKEKEKKEESMKLAVKLPWQEEVDYTEPCVLSKTLDLMPRRLWRARRVLSREDKVRLGSCQVSWF